MSGSVGCGSLGGSFPTPAGVLANDLQIKWFRMGLGGRVASHSNP